MGGWEGWIFCGLVVAIGGAFSYVLCLVEIERDKCKEEIRKCEELLEEIERERSG